MENSYTISTLWGKSKFQMSVSVIIITAFILTLLFGWLDYYPLSLWDESRLASNSTEMYLNHNYIVTYYDGQPDHWNTKPPLMLFLQTISYAVFGFTEFSVRLPSAVAALLTTLVVIFFAYKHFANFYTAVLSAFILVSTTGYVAVHGSRSGDYDVLLVLFTTLYAFCFYEYLSSGKKSSLLFFFLALILAGLTKGIAATLLLPGIFLYAVIRKRLPDLLKTKEVYIGIFFLTMIVGGYYWLRERADPGYLQAVYDNELGGRFFRTLEEHSAPWYYYFRNFLIERFHYWILFTPLLVIGYNHYKNRPHPFSYLLLISFSYLLVISCSKTKLTWYDTPVFPFLSIMIAGSMHVVASYISRKYSRFDFSASILSMVVFMLILSIPATCLVVKNMFYDKTFAKKEERDYNLAYYLRSIKNEKEMPAKYIYVEGYCPQFSFYIKALNNKGIRLSRIGINEIRNGMKLMVYGKEARGKINTGFMAYDITYIRNNVVVYNIVRARSQR